ncbi:OprD family outer membrane porin [Pseudomonas laurylsulfatiphila]|jgi:hypothetical protein|uniref:OprD family outer membrane porin n=1 Tax=Pseudomonas laurylsulfatiphila TaxID=2011015 RepID=UPI003B830D7F
MKLQSLALGITLGGLTHQAIAAGFIDDSKASLNLRNFYFNSDSRESQGNVCNAAYASQVKEWGRGAATVETGDILYVLNRRQRLPVRQPR